MKSDKLDCTTEAEGGKYGYLILNLPFSFHTVLIINNFCELSIWTEYGVLRNFDFTNSLKDQVDSVKLSLHINAIWVLYTTL